MLRRAMPPAFCALAALTCSLALAQAPAGRAALPPVHHRIAVIAHRGGAGLAAENTLAAFSNAIALGADYVEFDVRMTRDRQLVLLHDQTLDRTTNGSGPVSKMRSEQLAALDAGAGEHVPTLDEALALCRGRINVYLDHKEGPTARIVKALARHGMLEHTVVYAGVERLQEWKRLAPQVPVMPSLPSECRREGGPAEFLRLLPAEVLDGHMLEWNVQLVREAHAAGAEVYVDGMGPVDNEAGYRAALELGVDGIQTDYPDRLIAALHAR